MHPNIILNWPAVIVAAVAGFAFGGVWYGPLFGKTWGKLMGMNMDAKPDPKVMKRAFALQFVGLFLTSYVLTFTAQVWRPSVWNLGPDVSSCIYACMCAFFVWLGFYVPQQLGKIAWESRPWKLFFLNIAHDFLSLMVMSIILSYWR